MALVNPGSIGVDHDQRSRSILKKRVGWVDGWADVCVVPAANARYFAAASLGEASDRCLAWVKRRWGSAIDFLWSIPVAVDFRRHGGGDRVGYVDPPGTDDDRCGSDRDPASGTKKKELAKPDSSTFVLTRAEGQSLWQYPGVRDRRRPCSPRSRARTSCGACPIVRVRCMNRIIVQTSSSTRLNPYRSGEAGGASRRAPTGIRSWIIATLFAVDDDGVRTHELRDPPGRRSRSIRPIRIRTEGGRDAGDGRRTSTDPDVEGRCWSCFDRDAGGAEGPDGSRRCRWRFDGGTSRTVEALGGCVTAGRDTGLWHPHGGPRDELRRQFTPLSSRQNYQAIVRLAEEESGASLCRVEFFSDVGR